MDKICEFHFESKARGSMTFDLNDGKKLILPVQKPHSNKLATSFIAPNREVDVFCDMIPEDVSLVRHKDRANWLMSRDNQISAFSNNLGAVKSVEENKVVKIIVLDAFALERPVMNQIEREIRQIRILFAQKNIATTLHHAYPINSANHEAYKSENFALFEGLPFPVSVDEMNRFDLVLTLEQADQWLSYKEPFFRTLMDNIRELKKPA